MRLDVELLKREHVYEIVVLHSRCCLLTLRETIVLLSQDRFKVPSDIFPSTLVQSLDPESNM